MKRLLPIGILVLAFLCSALAGLSGAAQASPAGRVALPGGPMVRAAHAAHADSSTLTISENWSGYAAVSATKKFNDVHSTFVQPTITCPGIANQWTSNWVGLDGYNDATVEQDGTFSYCGGPHKTTPVYKAWYELYPADSVNVFSVQPGDVMDASVRYAAGTFALRIADLTTGKSATDTATCATCERSSAEWIVERPALCNNAETKCFLTRLADFGSSAMGGDEAQFAGSAMKSVGEIGTTYALDMVDPLAGGGFQSLDTVGPVARHTFTATWDRTGNTVPISLD